MKTLKTYNQLFENQRKIFTELLKDEKYRDYDYINKYIENGDLDILNYINNNTILNTLIINYFDDDIIIKTIDIMLKKNINFNYVNWKNKNVLFFVIEKRRIKIFKYLMNIEYNFNINHQDSVGNTILMKMCSYNKKYYNYIKILFEKYPNVDLDLIDSFNESALIIAARELDQEQDLSVINFLIEKGAYWFIKDENNNTFLDYLTTENCDKLKSKYEKEYNDSLLKKNMNEFNI